MGKKVSKKCYTIKHKHRRGLPAENPLRGAPVLVERPVRRPVFCQACRQSRDPAGLKMRKLHCGASLQTRLCALVNVEPFFVCLQQQAMGFV